MLAHAAEGVMPYADAVAAFSLQRHALRLLGSAGGPEVAHMRATAWRSLAYAWWLCRLLNPAADCYSMAAVKYMWAGRTLERARCLANQASCLHETGIGQRALPLYETAEAILRSEGALGDWAAAVVNHASCLLALGQARQALQLYRAAERIQRV